MCIHTDGVVRVLSLSRVNRMIRIYKLVCMCVCQYLSMYVCMYVFKYVCVYVCMYIRMYVCTYVCMYGAYSCSFNPANTMSSSTFLSASGV